MHRTYAGRKSGSLPNLPSTEAIMEQADTAEELVGAHSFAVASINFAPDQVVPAFSSWVSADIEPEEASKQATGPTREQVRVRALAIKKR